MLLIKNNLKELIENLKVEINFKNNVFNGNIKTPWTLSISKKGNDIIFTGGAEEEIIGSFLQDGHFSFNSSAPFPMQLSADGKISENIIDIRVKDIYFEADDLSIGNFTLFEGVLNR